MTADDHEDLVRYRLSGALIDGPALPLGTEAGMRLLVEVGDSDGEALALRITDWAGPWHEPHTPSERPVIAEHILDACTQALEHEAARIDPGGDYSDVARDLARAVIEAVARCITPTNNEAAAMVVGVLTLDVKKLTATGDQMASVLDGLAWSDGDQVRALTALWKGQAHHDWEDHHARRARGRGDEPA